MKRQLEPAAQRKAVYRRDDRLAERQQHVIDLPEGRFLIGLAELPDIRAANKAIVSAGQHQRPYIGVGPGLFDCRHQSLSQVVRQRIDRRI